jgi:hypothetical protein
MLIRLGAYLGDVQYIDASRSIGDSVMPILTWHLGMVSMTYILRKDFIFINCTMLIQSLLCLKLMLTLLEC